MDDSTFAGTLLLIARLVLGLGIAAHGAQKLFGWFGGHGLAGTGGVFGGLGLRPGPFFAFVAGLGELGGGVLTALGLLGPVGPSLVIAVMIVAAVTVHLPHGFFVGGNGVEVPGLYASGALLLLAMGFGRYSVDAATGLGAMWNPARDGLVLAIAVLGAVLVLLARTVLRRSAAPAASR